MKEMAIVAGGFLKEVEHIAYIGYLIHGLVEHKGLHYKVVRYSFAPRMTWGIICCLEHPYTSTYKLV
jgi:hypothetical protein